MMANNRYAYLLVFDTVIGSLQEVSKFLDKREDIFQNWMTVLPNSFFVISDKSAKELSEVFRTFTNDQGSFIILDVKTDRNGWLPKKAWEFVRKPKAIWEQ
ncbi:hypothetical protein Syn6312_2285 [Synechococcus sp. PCC 6312]|nr:hypothetical protein Syn6312_2285 [Synechococcus sp. PCC 6312]